MENRSGGRFKAEVVYGGALGTSKEQLDNIKAGLFEMGPLVAHYTPGKVPLLNGKNLPTLPPTETKEIGLWTMAVHQHPAVVKEMEEWNAVYLIDTFLPTYNLIGNKPLRRVEDFKGLKINVSGLTAELLKNFGAVGVTFSGPEWYETLERGIADLVFAGDYAFGSYKLYQVSKYWNHGLALGAASDATVANKNAWDALPDDIKKIAEDLRVEVIDEYVRQYEEAEVAFLAAVEEWELEDIAFPQEERAKLVAGVQPIIDSWVTDIEAQGLPGRELVDYMLAQRQNISGY
jgi:TRAP-type C4-dicarboxylate transport system substrate-binding protein